MADQTDMDQIQIEMQAQASWGEPRWYAILSRLSRIVNSMRVRLGAVTTRVAEHDARLAALEDRVTTLEQPPTA